MAMATACLAASILSGFSSPALAQSGERYPGLERPWERMARRERLVRNIRVAASDRLIEAPDEIGAYLAAGFNTIVLWDTESGLEPKSEERIAFELAFARAHDLSVLVGKATDALPDAQREAGDSTSANERRPFAIAALGDNVSDEEIRDRLALWDRYGHDVILGVFFLYDDACLLQVSAERQRHLYGVAHETVRDWYVFGMIGEFCYGLPMQEAGRYFDVRSFDHLIVVMYPLSLSMHIGPAVDVAAAADPDSMMRTYVRDYVEHMGEKFIRHLRPGQMALFVVQTFAYYDDAAGRVPRSDDVFIQAVVCSETVRRIPGQRENRSIAYFLWDGSRGGMFGLLQRPDWLEAAARSNARLHRKPRAVDPRP